MTIHYISNNAELAAVTPANGNTILLKTNTTFSASSMRSDVLDADNVTIGEWGTGAKPIIDGSVQRSDFTSSASAGVYQRSYGSNVVGNVTEDGLPLKFIPWNTNLATTAAAMPDGSFSFDYTGLVLYVKPSAGIASEHSYRVSETLYGINSLSQSSNFLVTNLCFRQVSRHAFLVHNKKNSQTLYNEYDIIGGMRDIAGSYWLGNGEEWGRGCVGNKSIGPVAQDIFDSAYSPQVYGSVGFLLSGHVIKDAVARRCGLHGIEISIQSSAPQAIYAYGISDVITEDFLAEDINRNCWSNRNLNGAAYTVLINGGRLATIRDCHLRGMIARRVRWAILNQATGGANSTRDVLVDDYTSGLMWSVPTAGKEQADLWANVRDTAGNTPTGSALVQSNRCGKSAAFLI